MPRELTQTTLVAGLSGGKDSTAMVLELARRGERGTLLFNVVGGELPDLLEFVKSIATKTGWPLVCTSAGFSLMERIRHYRMIPNAWARWCTRELKILPTIDYLEKHPGLHAGGGFEGRRRGTRGAVRSLRGLPLPAPQVGMGVG